MHEVSVVEIVKAHLSLLLLALALGRGKAAYGRSGGEPRSAVTTAKNTLKAVETFVTEDGAEFMITEDQQLILAVLLLPWTYLVPALPAPTAGRLFNRVQPVP